MPVYIIAMDRALKTYIPTKGSFSTFFKSVYLFELYREVGKELQTNSLLFGAISLSSKAWDEIEGMTLIELVEDKEESNPRETYEKNQMRYILRDSSCKDIEFPNFEQVELQRKVLIFTYFGYNFEEIAEILKISRHKIRYLLKDCFAKGNTPLAKIKSMYQK